MLPRRAPAFVPRWVREVIERSAPEQDAETIELTIRCASSIARWLRRRCGVEADDVWQSVVIGCLEAARHYDPRRGSYKSFVFFHIRQAVQRFSLDHRFLIPMSGVMLWRCFRIKSHAEKLRIRYGDSAGKDRLEILLRRARISPARWDCFQRGDRLRSLNQDPALSRRFVDRFDMMRELHDLDWALTRAALRKGLAELRPKHAMILRMRYGIERAARTLKAIADQFHVTAENIRLIQRRSERRLHKILIARAAKGLDGDEWLASLS